MALSEFHRVIRPNGFVVITCPDLQSACELVANDKLTDTAYHSPAGSISPIDIIYGHRGYIAAGNSYMAHRCGFTAKVLASTLRAAGFETIALKRRKASFDLWAVGLKAKNETERIEKLYKEHFPT